MEDFSPAHLAEQFRDIYDKEWKCALEELTVVMERDIALAYLAKITRVRQSVLSVYVKYVSLRGVIYVPKQKTTTTTTISFKQ